MDVRRVLQKYNGLVPAVGEHVEGGLRKVLNSRQRYARGCLGALEHRLVEPGMCQNAVLIVQDEGIQAFLALKVVQEIGDTRQCERCDDHAQKFVTAPNRRDVGENRPLYGGHPKRGCPKGRPRLAGAPYRKLLTFDRVAVGSYLDRKTFSPRDDQGTAVCAYEQQGGHVRIRRQGAGEGMECVFAFVFDVQSAVGELTGELAGGIDGRSELAFDPSFENIERVLGPVGD